MLLACCLCAPAYGQQSLSNARYKQFATGSDVIKLDSLSVVPNTVVVRAADNTIVDESQYDIKAFESKLIWIKKPVGDSIRIFFRVFPFSLAGETFHKNYIEYKQISANSVAHPFTYNPEETKGNLVDFGSLNYAGSFSRSVGFGTSQDVTLNSVFNLQLSGMLTKDLEITAAITDNNIPIQPEGNTQQLQEFDKIFIQLRKDQHKVIVGDFDLNAPDNTHFLKFSRKYQGALYSGSFKIKKLGILRTTVGGGISRGKFARNTLEVVEGNQGPYQLIGASGETLITILANSEAVYIDGAKMDRGADRDYVIDYNLGEITFMPRRIITKDLRIIVEFQYANTDYARSAAYVGTDLLTKKVDLHFNFYSEQDAKNNNIQQTLNGDKIHFLSGLGDSVQKAFYRGYDTTTYDPTRILYALVPDTIVNGHVYDTVFVYSTDSTKAKFTVNFSLVNPGDSLADYVATTNIANGRVYQWVAPIIDSAGVMHHQGTYARYILLTTPKLQQMYTLGADIRINKNNFISTEVAMSNSDPNTFSSIDNNTHIGFAGHILYRGTAITKGDSSSKDGQRLVYNADYEYIQNRFSAIDRFHDVEFNRDWNLDNAQTSQYNQHLASGTVGYLWNGLGSLTYQFKVNLEDTVYKGFDNIISGAFTKNGFRVVFSSSFLNSSSTSSTSTFIRPKADISYSIKKLRNWKIGVGMDHELNKIKDRGADTLANTSYLWQNYKAYIATPDSAKNKYAIEYTMRYEQHPNKESFQNPYYGAQGVNFVGSITTLKNQTLNFNLTYRHARNTDSINTNEPENFYLGRVDYNITALKGVIRSTTLYELGTGREQKTQIVYQLSPTNTGNYIWIDANHDGIEQINEFVLSSFKTDSSFVQVVIPTPEFVSVNTNQFNEVLNINPAAVWKSKPGIRKIVALFSGFASVQVNKKTYAGADKKFLSYFNPFPTSSNDTNIVSTTISSRNSLYFNRLNPKYGGQFDYNYSQGRSLLTGGFENHFLESEAVTARWNAFKAFTIQTVYTYGIKSNQSDFYADMKYRFTYNDINGDLSYQFGTKLRLDLKYEFAVKINPNDSVGKQTAKINKVTFEGRYNTLKKNTVNASISYATIQYNDKGFENDQLQYAMLDGLLNNNNLVWSVGYSQNLTNNIQMTISYDGRMTGFSTSDKSTMKPINTARAEIRAMF